MSEERFCEWAIVEVMGHRRFAGRVSEQEIAGGALLRIDVPAVGDTPGFTTYRGLSSIYALTPCTEAAALAAARQFREQPLQAWDLPRAALPGSEVNDGTGDDGW